MSKIPTSQQKLVQFICRFLIEHAQELGIERIEMGARPNGILGDISTLAIRFGDRSQSVLETGRATSISLENAQTVYPPDGGSTMRAFYHVTPTENVSALLSQGADASYIGCNAPSSHGTGFHVSRTYQGASVWGHELFPEPLGPATTILRVTLPGTARIAESRDLVVRAALEQWGKAKGYLKAEGRGLAPTEQLLRVLHKENWPEDSDYYLATLNDGVPAALQGLYLAEQGFDGYWVDNDVVLTNFSLLTHEAFSEVVAVS